MIPRVSVIVPVYRTEKYLPACLDSILAQTFRNMEIILVDDGSDDASPGICDAYAGKDPRIICIHRENAGAGAARNAGLERCGGEYICFVDSDDVIAPDFVEKLVLAAERTGAEIARGSRVYLSESGKMRVSAPSAERPVTSGKTYVWNAVRESRECQVWANLFCRPVLEGIFFDPDRRYEDVLFQARVFGRAEKVVFVPDAVYGYRRNPAGLSLQPVTRGSLDALYVREQRIGCLEKAFPDLVPAARLELAAEAVQILVRMKKTAESPALKEELRGWLGKYPYSVKEVLRSGLRPATRLILVLAKISLPGTVGLLKLRKRLRGEEGGV